MIKSLFESDGAHIEILDAEEHDEIMAVVQALTHFAYISIGAALKALDFDVQRSHRFMSPVYEIMIDFVGRILDQNPELYASIQMNPKAAAARQTFVAECMRLCEKADAGDMEGFKQMMRDAALHYGGTHEALQRSDRVINARIREKEGERRKRNKKKGKVKGMKDLSKILPHQLFSCVRSLISGEVFVFDLTLVKSHLL